MSTTTSITHEALAALEAAIVRGVTAVSYGGNTVTYRSLADMLQIRDMMRRELGVKVRRPKSRRAVVRML